MTPDELAAIERRADAAAERRRTDVAACACPTCASAPDVPALIAAVRALRDEVATLRREALLRDACITTTSTGDRA